MELWLEKEEIENYFKLLTTIMAINKHNSKKKTPPLNRPFVFEQHDIIGIAAAEDDSDFLESCFIDTGNLQVLMDSKDPRHIVLGRTGSGKTALLQKIQQEAGNRAVSIDLYGQALNHVLGSTILQEFSNVGVNFEPFFKLLWRHVIAVEVFSMYFEHQEGLSDKKNGLLDRLRGFFSGDNRKDREIQDAIEYMEKWGKNFWEPTKYRVKEITQTMETNLTSEIKAKMGLDMVGIGVAHQGQDKLTEEQKIEIRDCGQKVISNAQVQDLNHILGAVDRVLSDPQKPCYIVIDALDEDWVEDNKIKYKLIMALMQTGREFNQKVQHAKIIIALRRDLLERVFKLAQHTGFQEEKYESMNLRLKWSSPQLVQIIEKRIQKLCYKKNIPSDIAFNSIMPVRYQNQSIKQYVTSIAPRPRDIISFFNCCINNAIGESKISIDSIRRAEDEYSQKRIDALGGEWRADYPCLVDFSIVLENSSSSFKINSISTEKFIQTCLTVAEKNEDKTDPILTVVDEYLNEVVDSQDLVNEVIWMFYITGLVGLKVRENKTAVWADEVGTHISIKDITDNTSIIIHFSYHKYLSTKI